MRSIITIRESYTVKLGINELFDNFDKELLATRNNFWATKKFLIAKFDCNNIYKSGSGPDVKKYSAVSSEIYGLFQSKLPKKY